MEKLVSVAITTYNGERFLRDQLNSIYDQTYKNIEVIASDDHSKDQTVPILEEYKKKYGLKYFINERNVGITKNFERVISLCKGSYIALADQDDIWLPQKIEILVNKLDQHSLIYSNFYLMNQDGSLLTNPSWYDSLKFAKTKQNQFKLLSYAIFPIGCVMMFKRELLEKILPIPKGVSHDWWISFVALKSKGIKYLDRPLICYRQHTDSSTGKIMVGNFFKKTFGFFFSEEELNRRRLIRRLHYIELNTIRKYLNFSKFEKNCLDEAIVYHRDLLTSTLHIKTAYIAIRNRHILFQNNSKSVTGFLKRWISILATIFF